MPQLGEKRSFWILNPEKPEDGPYEAELEFVASNVVRKTQYFWKVADDNLIWCDAEGQPYNAHALAESEREGYGNCIVCIRDYISRMEENIAFLESERDALDERQA